MKITNDPVIQRGGMKPGVNTAIFEKLTPENNCLVLDDKAKLGSISQQLEDWAKRRIPGCKVRTTGHYPTDGKPRVWLVYPEPVKTTIRGPFPQRDDA
jgi:hypothetical protein